MRGNRLVLYMRTVQVHRPASKTKRNGVDLGPSSSHSCSSSFKHSESQPQPLIKDDGADSQPGYVAVAHIRQHKRAAAALARQAIQRLQAAAGTSDSDFSSDYITSQHAHAPSRFQAGPPAANHQQALSAVAANTASGHMPLANSRGQACQVPEHNAGRSRKRGDPRLDAMRDRGMIRAAHNQASCAAQFMPCHDIVWA